MDHLCELKSLDGQQCQLPAFRDSDLCFWHAVWVRTRRRYRSIPNLLVRILELLAGGFFFWAGYMLLKALPTGEIIWLLLSTFVFGAALTFFAESIMGLAHPRSRPGVWPKLLASGLALQIIAALTIAITLVAFPQTNQPLVNLWNNHQWQLVTEHASLLLITGIAVSLALTALGRKILGDPHPRGSGLVWVLVCVALLNILAPEFLKHPFQSQIVKKKFWEAAIGSYAWLAMILSYLPSVIIMNKNGPRMVRYRLVAHDSLISAQALAQTYLANFYVPLLAMLATRYFMVWTGLNGFFFSSFWR